MLYSINYSRFISEIYSSCWTWTTIEGNSKEEAINNFIELCNKNNIEVSYILSIEEMEV